MNLALRSSFQCDDPDAPCGCPPGHLCWFCLEDKVQDALKDLLLNDPDVAAVLDAPRMGVVDGSAAIPGQVGEWVTGTGALAIPALGAGNNFGGMVASLNLPAGDWMCFPDAWWTNFYPSVAFGMETPPGLSNGMYGGLWGTSDPNARVAVGVPAHATLAQPTLLVFHVSLVAPGATAADTFNMRTQAIRIR